MFQPLATNRRRLRRGTRAFTREVDVGPARVFVDHGFQWDGANNIWLTRARGTFAMGAGPAFDIRPRSFFSRMVGMHGGIPDDDRYFADFFVVRSPQPESTWVALTTRARSLLASSFEDARLLSDGNMIALWREGEFGREADADAAIEIVGEIASFRSGVGDALASLPGASYRPAAGNWDRRTMPFVELRTPASVRLGPRAANDRLHMTATSDCGRSTLPYTIAIDNVGGISGAARHLTSSVARALADVGESTIRCDGSTIELCWTELETRKSALLAGSHLVGSLALASQSQGLYR